MRPRGKGLYLCVLLALAVHGARAHPVDEVVQGAYLTLAPEELRLELDITVGSGVAKTMLSALDHNADKRVTDLEARAYARAVLDQSTFMLDGVAGYWVLHGVTVPPFRSLELGTDTIKIYAVAKRPDRAGARTLTYQNRYAPGKSVWAANVFLQQAVGWHYQVTGQQRSDDGQRLTVRYIVTRL